jgi:hypothetical protein
MARELLGKLHAVTVDHREGRFVGALGPDPGDSRHDKRRDGLIAFACAFPEEAGERLLGGLVDGLVLGEQRQERALNEPDGLSAEVSFKLASGDVEPGGNRAARRQNFVIGGNVDQIVLDTGAEGVQWVLAVGSERGGRQNDAGAAGTGDAGEDLRELVGCGLMALVDEDHTSPLPEPVEGAQEVLVIELVDH